MSKYTELLHQSLAVMTVASNEFSIGIGVGWTAPVLNALQTTSEYSLTPDESSWIASIEHFGKIFGVLITTILLDRVGRKPVLMASALLFFLMWIGLLRARTALIICLIRFVFGFAFGLNDSANSMYLGEVSSPVVRSVLGSISMTMFWASVFVEFVIATYLSYTHIAVVNAFITFTALFSLFWLVEPPQFLLMKGKDNQALENFMWLKGVTDPNDVHNEFEKIKQNVQEETQKTLSMKTIFTSPANYKSVLIVLTIYTLAGAAGYYPITSYAGMIFSSTNSLSPNEFTILFGGSQLIVVLFTSFINKRFNRRPVIIIGFALAAFVHATTAALYYVHQHVVQVPYFSWIIFVTITAYASIYAFVYPTLFLIRAELFPLSVKVVGSCVSIIGMSITSFLFTKVFLYIYTNYGIYCNFLLFAIVNLVTVIFVHFALPETKNKSLIEIQEQLEKRK